MAHYIGNDSPNAFAGTWGPDLFVGKGGDDVAYGWDGADTFYGGAGNDTFFAQDGNDLIVGGVGDDKLDGGGGVDTLYGGDGNDWIVLGQFGGSVGEAYGGNGNDLIQVLSGGQDITLAGGAGIDTASFFFTAQNPSGDVVIDFSTTPHVAASAGGRFTLRGIEQVSVFVASAGHHHVTGGALADQVTLTDQAGASVVDMGAGADWVAAEIGRGHLLDGGAGQDRLRLTGLGPLTLVVDDATHTASGSGNTIRGFESYETVISGAVQVWFGAGHDLLYGGAEGDLAYGGANRDRLMGGRGADTLYGDKGNDVLLGGRDNDLLYGGTGNDDLYGGPGVDTLHGGAGDDVLYGGWRGASDMWGDDGADRFVFAGGEVSPNLIEDFTSGTDRLEFNRALLQFGPTEAGALPQALLAQDAAIGPGAQFVLTTRADLGEEWLLWDTNGADPAGGSYLILRFAAGTLLQASDIFLI